MDLKGKVFENVEWDELTQDREQLWDLVIAVMNIGVP
jgi:hypothetical protein